MKGVGRVVVNKFLTGGYIYCENSGQDENNGGHRYSFNASRSQLANFCADNEEARASIEYEFEKCGPRTRVRVNDEIRKDISFTEEDGGHCYDREISSISTETQSLNSVKYYLSVLQVRGEPLFRVHETLSLGSTLHSSSQYNQLIGFPFKTLQYVRSPAKRRTIRCIVFYTML